MKNTQFNILNMLVNHNPDSDFRQIPHYGPNYGFTKYNGSESVTEFKKTVVINQNTTEAQKITDVQHAALEIVHDLAKELIESRVPIIETSENPADSSTSVTVKMKIAPPDINFVSVEHDTFLLDGEKFTESEIASALKTAFPEKFI